MWYILKNPLFQKAVSLGFKKAIKHIDNKADLIVIEKAQAAIELEINKFILQITKRTKIYFFLSLVNLAALVSLYSFQNKASIYLAGCTSLLFLTAFLNWSVRGFLNLLYYIENFESHLKETIKFEFQKAQDENWKNRLAVFLKSKGADDYYRLVLDQSVKTVSSWLYDNKRVLYTRLVAYFIASTSFSLSLREVLLN